MGLYSFSEDINGKYSEIEEDLNRRLEKILAQEVKLKSNEAKAELFDNYVENTASLSKAMERNENTIKILEMTKARLRSKSTFSPLETVLKKACINYKKNPSFPPQDDTERQS
ncbi:hypothetical protein ACFFRR_008506 [Megaselia abdita]